MIPAICRHSHGSCAISDSTLFWNPLRYTCRVRQTASFFLTSASRKLTLQINRLSEEQFPSARKCSTPRGERLSSWTEPKRAPIQTRHSASTREAHDESSLAASLVFPSQRLFSYVSAPCEVNWTCGRPSALHCRTYIGAEGRYFRNAVRRGQHSNK